MTSIPQINIVDTTGSHRDLFDQINATFGTVPNLFTTIGNSEAALGSMWGSFGALGKGSLDPKLGEKIAVLVADINRCGYCLAAHTVLGQNAGASAEEMVEAQSGKSDDAQTQAALDFTKAVVNKRAGISPVEISKIKEAGFTNEGVAEILAHIALNIFTNYTNIAFNVPVDFPEVAFSSAA